jgi:hypothetical protein
MTLDLAKGSLGRGVVWRSGTSEERTGIITFTGGYNCCWLSVRERSGVR